MTTSNAKVRVQGFGRFLSNMVMPNIGAFVAWGIITTLFIPTGWLPNENLAKLVGPMITYLLPLLIGYTGGRMVGGDRGAVVGAVATMGVIVSASIPMFMGAMIAGPLGGWVIKKFDAAIHGKVKSGFEMLVNNFSSGIIGMILALIMFLVVGPLVSEFTKLLGAGVDFLVKTGLLPLTSILVEPAKVLFLNNAINHGVFTPLGTQAVAEHGKAIFFLIEANPGPGLGLLLAYMLFGKGDAKGSAPAAAIIHFFGGIHEIYFPFVLMKPRLILAMIAGGMTGVFLLVLFNAGLRAPASPGSIFAVLLMTPKDSILGVLASVTGAAAVSFFVASFFLKMDKSQGSESLDEAAQRMSEMKAASKGASVLPVTTGNTFDPTNVRKVIVACDAGMGSSAMGASLLRRKLDQAGLQRIVSTNMAINNLPEDVDVVITHSDLTERARRTRPQAVHLSLTNFLDNAFYDKFVAQLQAATPGSSTPTLGVGDIHPSNTHCIVFVDEQAHGPHEIGANLLRRKLIVSGVKNIDIRAAALDQIPSHADVIISSATLAKRAQAARPNAIHIATDGVLDEKLFDLIVAQLGGKLPDSGNRFQLAPEHITLGLTAASKEEAIRMVGEKLVAQGSVTPAYVDAMLEREKMVSTYMGQGLAIPHGTNEAKDEVLKTGVALCQFPKGIRFGSQPNDIAYLVVGIAAKNNEHVSVMAALARALEDEQRVSQLAITSSKQDVLDVIHL